MGSGDILIASAVSEEIAPFRAASFPSVRCIVTGMGSRSGQVVRRELKKKPCRLVISVGFAGGLRAGFQVGDLVMASEVIEGGSRFRRPAKPAYALDGMASVGPFLTVPSVMSQSRVKQEMGERYGAIAVDMETASVAQAASEAGIEWVGIRSILDPMEVTLPVASGWDAMKLLVVPGRWSEFYGFTKAVHSASDSLAIGLQRFLRQ